MKDKERDRIEAIGTTIVHSAIQVHRSLGPGLLEGAYQACYAFELRAVGFDVRTEVKLPVSYRGFRADVGYRIDMLVNECVVIENKAVDRLLPIHTSQVLTYLELGGFKLGYLLNLNVGLMKHGVHRFVFRL
jgi:GxxExxY protein